MLSAPRPLLTLALSALAAQALSAQPTLLRDGLGRTEPQIATELPRFLTAQAAHFLDWLADGSMLIRVEQGTEQHVERVRSPLAEGEAVSLLPAAAIGAIVARPYTSDAFVYAAPHPGGADAGASVLQLSLQQIGADARALADIRPDAGPPAWAHDGKQLAFIGGTDGAVYVIDTADSAAVAHRVVAADAARWRVLGWSIDDQMLLLGREASESEDGGDDPFELFLATLHDGSLQPVAPPGASARRRAVRVPPSEPPPPGAAVLASEARFASDGHAILLLTRTPCGRSTQDASRRFLHLCYTDAAAGEWRALSAATPHDVELFDASPDGSYIAYTWNEDGFSRLMLLDLRLQLDRRVDALAPGLVTALKFDPTGKRLALSYESAGSPGEVDVFDPRAPALVRWTRNETTLLEAAAQVVPQLVRFPTWDELDGEPRQLSALLYSPTGASESSSPRAVVIWLCGNGAHPCRAGYDPLVQYLVQRLGLVVLGANVRATSESSARDDAVRDVGALLVWIGLQPGLDRDRVAVLGEGFGSQLALASLGQFGDRLRGAVAAFPAPLGPMPNALSIRRPVLLVQGLADSQVPAYQMAQLREALRASGVAVQYLAASQEGRRFTRADDREAYGEAAATFLEHLLR